MTELLKVESLVAGYGLQDVLQDISIRVDHSEVVGIVGSNGAGKTTLMKVLSGLLPKRQGELSFNGGDYGKTTRQKINSGVVLVAEGHDVVRTLSVYENLRFGTFPFWPFNSKTRWDNNIDFVYQLFPILKERSRQTAGLLSGGEQQMLSIGRALLTEPKLLLLDEPSLGLAPIVVNQVFDSMKLLRERCSMLIVEQNLKNVVDSCDRLYVMNLGKINLETTVSSNMDLSSIKSAYFGL
jgi:branched-chain amino acid transport system ATP-binding protein